MEIAHLLAFVSLVASAVFLFSGKVHWLISLIWLFSSYFVMQVLNEFIKSKRNDEKIDARIVYLVNKHINVLSDKYIMLVKYDDYGNLVLDDWNQEVKNFISSVLIKDSDLVSAFEYKAKSDSLTIAVGHGRKESNFFDSFQFLITYYDELNKKITELVRNHIAS